MRKLFLVLIALLSACAAPTPAATPVLRVPVETPLPAPVVLWVSGESFHAYVRQVAGRTLTFGVDGDVLVDEETGSTWDPVRGLAKSGPLKGESLQSVPSLSSYDWAWRDFYPNSEFYTS